MFGVLLLLLLTKIVTIIAESCGLSEGCSWQWTWEVEKSGCGWWINLG